MSIELLFGDACGNALPWTNLVVNSIETNNIIDLSGDVTVNTLTANTSVTVGSGNTKSTFNANGNSEVYALSVNNGIFVGSGLNQIILDTTGNISGSSLNIGGLFFSVDNSGNTFSNGNIKAYQEVASNNFVVGLGPNQTVTFNAVTPPIANMNVNIPDTQNAINNMVLIDNVGNVNPTGLTYKIPNINVGSSASIDGAQIQYVTSGGTPASLDYYEIYSLLVPLSGPFNYTLNGTLTRLGNTITFQFNSITTTAVTANLPLSTGSNAIPTRFYPSNPLEQYPIWVIDQGVPVMGHMHIHGTGSITPGQIDFGPGSSSGFTINASGGGVVSTSCTWAFI